jgi:Rrf2 family nitric oxide-sensitive transcriptional repressor
MRLTTFTDYSLRVLIYVAVHPDGRSTIGEIARAYKISEHHLTKVVHFLGKEGYLANVRGRGGGLRLARSPAEINVGEVVRLAEGGDVPAECFEGGANTCAITPACKLKFAMAEAVEAFYKTLRRFTLEDVVRNRRALATLLVTPPGPASPRPPSPAIAAGRA